MMAFNFALALGALLCLTNVHCEVEDLQPLVKSTEDTLQSAKTHVEHMLNLSPLPNQEQLTPVVKNESDHLAYEIKKLATTLEQKVSTGEHKAEVKEAVTNAVTELNAAAASLEHAGADLKEDNVKYYAAADKLLAQTKSILASGPCELVTPVIRGALTELAHDVNNYQYGIHEVIGPHEGGPAEGHHHEGGHHHQHHGSSSEESNESKESVSHDHSHHHH